MITSHLLCVKRRDWTLETRGAATYCTCGAPVSDDTREHSETLHRLLFPALYNDNEGANVPLMETI